MSKSSKNEPCGNINNFWETCKNLSVAAKKDCSDRYEEIHFKDTLIPQDIEYDLIFNCIQSYGSRPHLNKHFNKNSEFIQHNSQFLSYISTCRIL